MNNSNLYMEETMKIENMTSSRGNKIANQFIITTEETFIIGDMGQTVTREVVYFQSYDTAIVKRYTRSGENKYGVVTHLDVNAWDYSVTTGKYRNQFLGETKKETQAKIDSGEYQLVDLN